MHVQWMCMQFRASHLVEQNMHARSRSGEWIEEAITTTSQKLLYRPDANFGILVYGSALKINSL